MTEIMIPGIDDAGALYPIEKLRAHQIGAFHVAISVFLFAGDELLLQQRAAGKYHSGLKWANTCCTHPHWGESVADCAVRRLDDELGFSVDVTAKGVVDYRADVGNDLIEHERAHIFVGHVDKDALVIVPNPDEVAAVRWAPIAGLRAEVAARPDDFSAWLRIYLERAGETGLAELAA